MPLTGRWGGTRLLVSVSGDAGGRSSDCGVSSVGLTARDSSEDDCACEASCCNGADAKTDVKKRVARRNEMMERKDAIIGWYEGTRSAYRC